MWPKKLKLKLRQQEEALSSLNKILETKDSAKVERELVQKNAQLMEQLEICKKQVIKMKVQTPGMEMRKKMTSRLQAKNPSAF